MPSQAKILVVDDTPANIKILNEALRGEYTISVATSGQDALDIAFSGPPPDLILLDIMMPGMDGYEVCRRLKSDERTQGVPILFVTAKSEEGDEIRGLELGAEDYITKPISVPIVQARVKNHIQLKQHRDSLEKLVQERTAELSLTQDATIQSMATLAETRDNETGGHIRRTQNYVRLMAEHLRATRPRYADVDDRLIDLLYKSAPLHDIGKVGVPDRILLKPGKLTDDEFVIMKTHTTLGRNAILEAEKSLGSNSFLSSAREIAFTHHEKWDGSGYPQGLSGEDIPPSGRLMAIADVYDALISKRVYKPPYTHAEAVDIIRKGKGGHFDPDMVDAFLEIQEDFRQIALEFADHEEERVALGEAVSF